jgi:adenylate kinase family enzyme
MKISDTPLARQVRAIMESGGYVSDEITNEIVKDRLAQSDCDVGFLLDGYPRTLQQVVTLDNYLAETKRPLDAVISLAADTDEVVARLLKRAEIDGRSDDNEETIRVRLQVYAEQTEPLLEVYRGRGLLVESTVSARLRKFPSECSLRWRLIAKAKPPSSSSPSSSRLRGRRGRFSASPHKDANERRSQLIQHLSWPCAE